MTNGAQMLQTLRDHRPLLLACEAIGWLHMAGKAKTDFLRKYGGQPNDYNYEQWYDFESPPFPWSNLFQWVKDKFPSVPQGASNAPWPGSLTDFVRKHTSLDSGLLGLLQAAHGMASGIEKQSYPDQTVRYLNQDATHMWLASPFGYPVRNLLADPPGLLQPGGWESLLGRMEGLLDELANLGSSPPSVPQPWWDWREHAIGAEGWLRQAFLSTLAETRLPNNDVTLWDQSYVAAALFKSAVAGAVLTRSSFNWDNQLKLQTRWRVLTVGFGTRHYEARAVKIGDWTGVQREIEHFFEKVRRLIEVDLAIGSLVYRDTETLVFTFPGEQADGAGGFDDARGKDLKEAIAQQVDRCAEESRFETPPFCRLSDSTRSFVPMVRELQKAREALAIPVHRPWNIGSGSATPSGISHVCPVCLVRFNEPPGSAKTDNALPLPRLSRTASGTVSCLARRRRRHHLDFRGSRRQRPGGLAYLELRPRTVARG